MIMHAAIHIVYKVHAEWRGLPTRVNRATWTACSASRGGDLVVVSATCVPVQALPRVPTRRRRSSRAVRPRQCRTPREHGPAAVRPEPQGDSGR